MSEMSLRKTYKYKLKPTPAARARQFEGILWRCRTLYNTAVEQRITAYHRGHHPHALAAARRTARSTRGIPRSMRPFIARSCKMGSRGSTRPSKRSFAG